MPITILEDRCVVSITGENTRGFLNGLVTSAISEVSPQQAVSAALLTPQGKIVSEFLVFAAIPAQEEETLWLDCPAEQAQALIERLTFYKLRAKIRINRMENLFVVAGWAESSAWERAVSDPRTGALGWRVLTENPLQHNFVPSTAWHAHRIACSVPELGQDYLPNTVFPHDVMKDVQNGIAFNKGCYVGQEVVSRMQHRGTARTRIRQVRISGAAPPMGQDILAVGKSIGSVGSTVNQTGLALMRIDRLEEALARGETLTCAGSILTLNIAPDTAAP
jgi:tRNA-modifying protein YgfZ